MNRPYQRFYPVATGERCVVWSNLLMLASGMLLACNAVYQIHSHGLAGLFYTYFSWQYLLAVLLFCFGWRFRPYHDS